jgi:hypothetical protein
MRMQMINASLHSGDIRRGYHTDACTELMELNVLYRERSEAIYMLRRRYPDVPEEAYSQPERRPVELYWRCVTKRAAELVQRGWRRTRPLRAANKLVRRLAVFRHTPQLIGNHDVLSMIIRLFGESS